MIGLLLVSLVECTLPTPKLIDSENIERFLLSIVTDGRHVESDDCCHLFADLLGLFLFHIRGYKTPGVSSPAAMCKNQ